MFRISMVRGGGGGGGVQERGVQILGVNMCSLQKYLQRQIRPLLHRMRTMRKDPYAKCGQQRPDLPVHSSYSLIRAFIKEGYKSNFNR